MAAAGLGSVLVIGASVVMFTVGASGEPSATRKPKAPGTDAQYLPVTGRAVQQDLARALCHPAALGRSDCFR